MRPPPSPGHLNAAFIRSPFIFIFIRIHKPLLLAHSPHPHLTSRAIGSCSALARLLPHLCFFICVYAWRLLRHSRLSRLAFSSGVLLLRLLLLLLLHLRHPQAHCREVGWLGHPQLSSSLIRL